MQETNLRMDKASLEQALKKYILYTKDNNYHAVTDCLYSGIFKLIPKESLLQQLEKSFKDDPVTNYLHDFSIHNLSEIFEIDDLFFSKVEYYLEMKIDRHEDVLNKILQDQSINYDLHNKEMQVQIDTMIQLLSAIYGKEHVKYDAVNDEFRIWQLNTLLAVYEKDKWKFIRWMSGSVYQRIFPRKILKKLATRFYLLD